MVKDSDLSGATFGDLSDLDVRVEQRPNETVVTARLRPGADQCYGLFCDVDRIPQWLWVVDTAVVQERDAQNRATRVDFIGSLERAAIGYSLSYSYDDERREVRWHHVGSGVKELAGSARFIPHPAGGCTLEYRLTSELSSGLPPWADQLYRQRPAETVVIDFCEYVEREARDPGES